MRSGGRYYDGVKRSVLRKAERSVAVHHLNVAVAESLKVFACDARESLMAFDRLDHPRQFCQDGCLVARAAAYLESLLVA